MKFSHVLVSILLVGGCRSTPPAADPPKSSESPAEAARSKNLPLQVEFTPQPPVVKKELSPPVKPAVEPREEPRATVKDDRGTRTPTFADVIGLQKAVVSQNGSDEKERKRLAILHILAHELLAADEVLQTVKTSNEPFFELASIYLTDNLGEHGEAEARLGTFLDHWRQQAGLHVSKSILCDKIDGFRQYVPSASTVLAPGSRVPVYVEIQNFRLKKLQDRHALHLKYEWELLDDRGGSIPVEQFQKAKPSDRETYVEFNGPVTEFHQNFRLPVPRNLAVGRYVFRIGIEDVNSGKKTNANVEFQVKAQ